MIFPNAKNIQVKFQVNVRSDLQKFPPVLISFKRDMHKLISSTQTIMKDLNKIPREIVLKKVKDLLVRVSDFTKKKLICINLQNSSKNIFPKNFVPLQ